MEGGRKKRTEQDVDAGDLEDDDTPVDEDALVSHHMPGTLRYCPLLSLYLVFCFLMWIVISTRSRGGAATDVRQGWGRQQSFRRC